MRKFLIFGFLFFLLLNAQILQQEGYIDIPSAGQNSGIFINVDGSYPIFSDANIDFDPNAGIELYYEDFSGALNWYDGSDLAVDLSYRFLEESGGFPSLKVGVKELTYNKYISVAGSDTMETFGDEMYLDRPPEVASLYLVGTKSMGNNAEITAGIGRGRFVGYGPRSKYFNYDIFFEEAHENIALGLFGGLKYRIGGSGSFTIEGDGRDLNMGFQYENRILKLGLSLIKIEQFFAGEDSLNSPRIHLGLSYNIFRKGEEVKEGKKKEKPGVVEVTLMDSLSGEEISGSAISGSGRVYSVKKGREEDIKLKEGSHVFYLNSKGYQEKKLQFRVYSGEDKDLKIYLAKIRKEEEEIEKEEEKVEPERDISGIITEIEVQFPFNKSYITDEFYGMLDRLVEVLEDNPEIEITVVGHADSVGTREFNQELSEERARNVEKYLIDQGISGDRIYTEAYGETRPIADNGTEEGRAKNRRVEFILGRKR